MVAQVLLKVAMDLLTYYAQAQTKLVLVAVVHLEEQAVLAEEAREQGLLVQTVVQEQSILVLVEVQHITH
jgi:hypothetical protein